MRYANVLLILFLCAISFASESAPLRFAAAEMPKPDPCLPFITETYKWVEKHWPDGATFRYYDVTSLEKAVQNREIDIVLTETNVDSLSMDTIKITVSANGEPKNLEEGTDYTITSVGGNGNWSQYTYKIDKSVFQGDGSYLVTVYSEDNAGNINENINESKKAEIGFGVDGTAPVIVPINIEEGQSYNTQNYEATVSVIDNLVLQDIKVTLNGQTLSYTQDGDDISFSIPESDKRQTVAISAKDAAGNEVDCEIADLLVSTNSLIRLLNNTPAVIAIVCGVAVVGVGTGVFAGLRRKRIVHIKRKN